MLLGLIVLIVGFWGGVSLRLPSVAIGTRHNFRSFVLHSHDKEFDNFDQKSPVLSR
jgi:hypothetical protein